MNGQTIEAPGVTPARRYTGERRCRCGTVLSTYNPHRKCAQCKNKLDAEAIEKLKPRKARKLASLLAVLLALGLGACAENIKMPDEDPGTWLRVERRATIPGGYYLWVGCDTATGNLLYFMAGDGRAIAVIPGGCK
jgi:hypothetical protein